MPDEPLTISEEYHERAVAQLLTKSWSELETLEHAGYLLFPDTLQRRKTDGTVEQLPVRLRVPRGHELRQARLDARKICEDDGLDPVIDRDLFDDVDAICVLARAIRSATEPFEPFEPDPRALERKFDRASLMNLWARVEVYGELINPRSEQMSTEMVIATVAAIARERNISPLVVFGSRAQSSFIVTTASLLANFLSQKPSSESSDASMPDS